MSCSDSQLTFVREVQKSSLTIITLRTTSDFTSSQPDHTPDHQSDSKTLLVDHDLIIDALTHRVRLTSVDQTSRLIGTDAGAAIAELESKGLITRATHVVSVPGIPDGPVFSWNGDGEPDFGLIAYQLRNRLSEPEEVEVLYPTADACRQYGGTRVLPRLSEITHDLLMTEAFLLSRDGVGEWRSGDQIRSDGDTVLFGGSIPDAAIFDGDRVQLIVEGGGTGYGRAKLSAMHSAYAAVAPYQLW